MGGAGTSRGHQGTQSHPSHPEPQGRGSHWRGPCPGAVGYWPCHLLRCRPPAGCDLSRGGRAAGCRGSSDASPCTSSAFACGSGLPPAGLLSPLLTAVVLEASLPPSLEEHHVFDLDQPYTVLTHSHTMPWETCSVVCAIPVLVGDVSNLFTMT